MSEQSSAFAIRHLLSSGASQRQVADRLKVSRHTVRKVAASTRNAPRAPVTGFDDPVPKSGQPRRVASPAPLASLSGFAGRISHDLPSSLPSSPWNALLDRAITSNAGDAIGVEVQLLDADALSNLPAARIVDIATGSSPEVSRALWDFLRMAVAGYEIRVFKRGETEPDEEGQAALDGFRERLRVLHGDESVIYRKLFTAAWMRGAMILELVMDDRGRFPVDLATPDPAAFSFQLVDGAWVLGQVQVSRAKPRGEWIPMDRPTFRHVQIDPRPGRPEGRAPVSSALFPALFLLGLYQDLRRVIANQGYPRLDVSIDTEKLATMLSSDTFEDMQDFDEQANYLIDVVSRAMARVGPGDAYVHMDMVKINQPIGAITNELASIRTIIDGLERMLTRALKTMPLNMSIDASVNDANANRQWEMYVRSIKSIQQPAENVLGSIYAIALQALGFVCDVEVRFAELRASEAYRDQLTAEKAIANAGTAMGLGFLTPREAALEAVGHVSDAVALTYEDPDGLAKKVAAARPPAPAPAADGGSGGIVAPTEDEGAVNEGGGESDVAVTSSNAPRLSLVRAIDPVGDAGPVVPSPEDVVAGIERAAYEETVRALGDLLPPVPSSVVISDTDLRMATGRFDQLEPDFSGLLDAVPVEG